MTTTATPATVTHQEVREALCEALGTLDLARLGVTPSFETIERLRSVLGRLPAETR